jgi:serine/threonine protein kinase/cytochrome c-type biogenesis protein CcmH/NrfG
MIGKIISHYRILEKLGEGGMGVVYRAEDTKLGRAVAIKLLPQHLGGDDEAKRRFIQEAKAASALDHPNICTIHEIDETKDGRIFMVMALYEGRTVKEHLGQGPLDIARAVDIATGVARGLERAHERGIVHRDIKPANIMVASDGLVKIMDFGIAKLAGEATITRTGSSIGTVAYMSPEQASGGAVDHRTDIWSLGVFLYEMLTGRRPFGGDYDQAAIYAIMNEAPKPPSALRREVPADLDRVVMKAMAKSPAERFQSAGDMRAALESCMRSTAPGAVPSSGRKPEHLPSIAVLPFKDMSPQKDQDYLCEGIAEELLNALVQIEGLRVAARTSSAQFKDKAINVQAIGRELGVQSVLEGSVRKSGDRLRITAQLINVEDGYHLFSEKYDRAADDVFAIQDEISLAIVDKLKVKLLRDEKSKLVKRHTDNEEAYRLYLQGRYFWNRRHEGRVQRGLEYFQRAIAIDPDYALPYSGIADCYFSLGFFDFLAPKVAFGKCKEAALKAVELDPDLAEAHASLGNALFYFDWDLPAAEAEFRRAIGLNPNYAAVHYFYGMFLTAAGRFDDAVAQERRAMELDPIQVVIRAALAFTLRLADRNDEAIATSRASIEFDPNFFVSWLNLGQSYALIGKFADGEDAIRKADDLMGGTSTLILGVLGHVLEVAGKRDEARSILNRMLELSKSKYASAQLIAILYWIFDEHDAAFAWLERAIEERDHWVCYQYYLPAVREMRSYPRIQGILRRLGLDALP